jgi:hypothetical protein
MHESTTSWCGFYDVFFICGTLLASSSISICHGPLPIYIFQCEFAINVEAVWRRWIPCSLHLEPCLLNHLLINANPIQFAHDVRASSKTLACYEVISHVSPQCKKFPCPRQHQPRLFSPTLAAFQAACTVHPPSISTGSSGSKPQPINPLRHIPTMLRLPHPLSLRSQTS